MRKKNILPFLFAFIILAITGCASLQRIESRPVITLAKIEIDDVSNFETTLLIELRVFNSSEDAFHVTGIDCELELNGKRFARGISKTDTEIASYSTAKVPVTMYSSVMEMFRGIINMKGREVFTYLLTGNLRVRDESINSALIPFSSEGNMPIGLNKIFSE